MSKPSRDLRKDLDRRETELAEQTCMALLGDLSGSLAHECNNFLNVLMLQVAVLELELPPEMRSHLQEVRRQGTAFKNLVHHFQSYRQQIQSEPRHLDLNQVVKDALDDLRRLPLAAPRPPSSRSEAPGLEFLPAAERLPLCLLESDLKRLILLLVTSLRGGKESPGLVLRTEAAAGKACLRIEANRASQDADNLSARLGTLEWAACQSLARRLQGRLVAPEHETGPSTLVVEFPAAAH
jgi:signal transduction histidine kinase